MNEKLMILFCQLFLCAQSEIQLTGATHNALMAIKQELGLKSGRITADELGEAMLKHYVNEHPYFGKGKS
jgi:hypothetical protein